MFCTELVEGKDQPSHPIHVKAHSELGITAGLMCRMTENIHGQGKTCIMESGFSVLLGVFGQAIAKKRGLHWPRGVPSDEIDLYMQDKNISDVECFELTWDDPAQTKYCVYVLNEARSVTCFSVQTAHKSRLLSWCQLAVMIFW